MNAIEPTRPSAQVRLLAWLRSQGWLRSAYHLIPRPLREGALQLLTHRLRARTGFARTAAWREWNRQAHPDAPLVRAPGVEPVRSGVNIIGYVSGQFGLAEAARSYARALMEQGVPVALHDINLGLPNARAKSALDAHIDDTMPHRVSIIFVNPDYLPQALAKIGEAHLKGRHLIACWFWELERIPDAWLPSLGLVDEVLVASAFVEQAVARVTDKPVLRVPMPVTVPADSGLQRADFGLPDDVFVFLTTFDFSSRMERKNPEAAIRAFLAAFPSTRRDVRLVVKSSNGHRFPHWLKHLLALAAGDDRILIRDDVIEREHLTALQRCSNAYVSLHRAEGFGLGMAECMAMGKPVIATAWSGNMEFMDAGCAALVDYTLVPVRAGEYPGGEGLRWADPDIEQASAWMRRLVDEPGLAPGLGERGRQHVDEVLSGRHAARQIIIRTGEIEAGRMSTQQCIQEPLEEGETSRD